MQDHSSAEAPDFTKACIVMFGVNITWIFMVIWAIWGLLLVMIVGAFINHLMTRLRARADARAQQMRRAPRARVRS